MTEVLLVLVGVLLTVTVSAAVEYYRQLRKVQKEYEKAKGIVDDIVLSFNRQLKREGEKLELVAYKVEAVSSRSDKALKKAEEVERQWQSIEAQISAELKKGKRELPQINVIDRKIREVAAAQESLAAKLSEMEQQLKQFQRLPEAKVEAAIPIKRDRALAPLTETELSVLEMLAMEGPKTAPEIKERIRLSREHTARLMKKLYEEGYLERDTRKIPFKYHVKKEMKKILKKTENKTA